jgi:hypothetical protein
MSKWKTARKALDVVLYCLALLAMAVVSMTCFQAPVQAAELKTLAYANFEGYSTALVLVNEGSEPIEFPGYWKSLGGVGGAAPVVKPASAWRAEGWPKEGGGVKQLEVPDGLRVYTEVLDPNGSLLRVEPLVEVPVGGSAAIYDPVVDPRYDTYLFVGALEATGFGYGVIYSDYGFGMDGIIGAGGAQILKLGAGARRAVVTPGAKVGAPGVGEAPLYVMAFASNNERCGAMVPLRLSIRQ